MVVLAGLSAARFASASFDEPSIPIGDVSSLDGIVSGTVRLTGDRLVFFSGDRFRSNKSNLAVNFASGGSLVLCPHSQVQVLAANRNSGIMLAFAEGGSEQPFPMHPSDVVMTPDWRIEIQGDIHPADLGELQLSTTRSGDLCLSGTLQTGEYFHISQLVGDTAYNFPGQGSVRIARGRIDDYPAGCSCGSASIANTSDAPAPPDNGSQTVSADQPANPVAGLTQPSAAPYASASTASSALVSSSAGTGGKQRSQDVAGYLRSFIHVIFGR